MKNEQCDTCEYSREDANLEPIFKKYYYRCIMRTTLVYHGHAEWNSANPFFDFQSTYSDSSAQISPKCKWYRSSKHSPIIRRLLMG